MAGELPLQLAAGGVEDLQIGGTIVGTQGHLLAVGREGGGKYVLPAGFQFGNLPAGGNVPDLGRAAPAADHKAFAIGREGEGLDAFGDCRS